MLAQIRVSQKQSDGVEIKDSVLDEKEFSISMQIIAIFANLMVRMIETT